MNKKKWVLLSIGSFICYYSIHKHNFIQYCELVITKDGQICVPLQTSHKNILIDLVREYTGRIPDDGIGINELVKMTDSVCVCHMKTNCCIILFILKSKNMHIWHW